MVVSCLVSSGYSETSFFALATVQNCLTTGDRLLSWGFAGEKSCVFCKMGTESLDHLFFQCSFSTRIWRDSKECMLRCCVSQPCFAWQDVMEEGCKN
jgi:hypothetical protein